MDIKKLVSVKQTYYPQEPLICKVFLAVWLSLASLLMSYSLYMKEIANIQNTCDRMLPYLPVLDYVELLYTVHVWGGTGAFLSLQKQ